jgi:hypothetical protein
MSEGIHVPKREGEGDEPAGQSGGLGAQAPPPVKRFFLVEYVDEVRRGLKWMRSAPKPETNVFAHVQRGLQRWSRLRKARLGAVIVVVIVGLSYGLFSAQAGTTPLLAAPIVPGGPTGPGTHHNGTNISDSVGENSEKAYDEVLPTTTFKSFTVILTWMDESTPVTQVNEPDSLGLKLVAPNGMNYSAGPATNPVGGQGKVAWALNDTGKDMGGTNWKIVVVGGTMGDVVRPTGRPCLPGVCPIDRANTFQMSIDYTW